MARGSIAKQEVVKKIQAAFGADYIGEFDKKFYVQAQEGNEMVQIAIALTCPKTTVSVSNAPVAKNGELNFEDDNCVVPVTSGGPAEITDEERENIANLMAKLGL